MNLQTKQRFGSFTYLNLTQFLGALNDNVFKFLIIFFLIDLQGAENSPLILSKAGAIFVIPFLLFSTSAGKLADRFSKRNIIVFSKAMEVVVMALGATALYLKSSFGTYVILFLMATQSAIFSPSKYGIVPELVSYDRISKANGLLTSFTFLAIIIGTFLATFITDISGRNFVFASFICTFIAIAGLWASLKIEYTPPAGVKKRISPFFLYEVYTTINEARAHNRLFLAILGSAFFLFLGAYLQLNIIPFGIQSLGLTDTQGGYLFLITALGIGSGSFLAGKLSGKHVELGLAPIAGLGITLTCFGLYYFSSHLYTVVALIALVGVFGGMWIVPFDSFIQVSSPERLRGQMVATTNFLSFLGVLFASAVLYLLSDILLLKASEGFLFIAILCSLATAGITFATLDYFLRFFAHSFSKLFFRLTISGYEQVPKNSPSLILCNRPSSLKDALLLTGIQRPPLRFLIESTLYKKKWICLLLKLTRIILIPPQYSLKEKEQILTSVKKELDKGFTVCLFAKTTKQANIMERYVEDFQKALANTPYFIIPVSIHEKRPSAIKKTWANQLKHFPKCVSISFEPPHKL